jgi:hypothetical protein
MNIAFTAPSRGNVTLYQVALSPSPGGSYPQTFTGTTYTLTGLTTDTLYTINVIARNANGDSVPLTGTQRTLLIPPSQLTSILGNTSINISYTAPPGGSGYTYDISTNPTGSVAIPQGIISTNYNITGLQVDTSYTIFVVSRNGIGNRSLPLTNTYRTLLSPPTNLTATLTDTTIYIGYTRPTGGSAYTFDISTNPATSVAIPQGIADVSYNITGLQADTSYTLFVVSRNANGNYSIPLTNTYRTLLSPPSQLTTTLTNTSINISFTASTTASATKYDISASSIYGNIGPITISGTTYNLTGLQVDTSYNLSIVAKNADDTNTSLPLTGTRRTLLVPPTNLITTPTDTTMYVSYTRPSGGSAYIFDISINPTSSVPIPQGIADTSYNITGLEVDTSYTIFVVSRNATNTNTSLPLTGTQRTLLSPPTNLIVTNITDTSMNVAFTASTTASVTNYEISATSIKGNIAPTTITNSPYVLSGLQNDTSYNINIVAKNADDTNTSLPLTGTRRTLLPPPTNLIVTTTDTSMNIAYTASTGSSVTNYEITITSVNGTVGPILNNTATSYVLTGLTKNIIYTISVVAKNAINNTSLPLIGTSQTKLPPPTNLQPTGRTSTSIAISFDPPSDGITYTYDISTSPVSIGSSVTEGTGGNINVIFPPYTIPVSGLNNSLDGVSSLQLVANGTRIVCCGQSYGALMFFTYNGTTWNNRVDVPVSEIPGFFSLSVLPDGSRGVCSGYYGFCYVFTWTGTTYTGFTQTRDTISRREGCGFDMTPDGNTIVFTHTNGGNPRYMYFAKWENGNYNAFTQTLDVARNYFGAGISADGSKIAYGITNANIVYVAYWNGTNYGLGTAINTSSIIYSRHIRFSPDGNIIYATPMYDVNGSVQYSLWNGTNYSTFQYVPTTSMPGNRDTGGFFVQTDGSIGIGVGNSIYKCAVTTISAKAYNINGLQGGTSYTISVNSRNAENNVSLPVTTTYNTLLLPPTNVQGVSRTETSITISFTEPAGSIDSYMVYATYSGGSITPQTFSAPRTSCVITGLQNGTTYTISVVSKNAITTSANSTSIDYYTTLSAPALSSTSSTDSSITILYTPPSPSVTSYTIEATPTFGSNVTQIFSAPAYTPYAVSYQITGLDSNMFYTITMFATNANENSSTSTTTYHTAILPPTSLIAIDRTTNSIDISFNVPSGLTADSYTINAVYSGGSITPITFVPSGSSSVYQTYSITGLSPTTQYTINVFATKVSRNSSASTSITYSTLISPPTNLMKTAITDTTMDISFNKPAGTITSYTVNGTYSGGSITPQTFNNSGVSSVFQTYQITGLLPGTTYTVNVIANNTNISTYSLPSNSITETTLISPPSNLIPLSSNPSTSTIDISFNKPAGTFTSYTVNATYSGGSITPQTITPSVDSNAYQTYTITGLQEGTKYTITVTTNNGGVSSSPSTSILYATNPSPPANFQVIARTSSSLTISFTLPTIYDAISYFVVQITDINNPTRYIYPPFTAPTTTFVIDNLTGNTQYSINIASRITVPSIPATIPATDFVISSVATSNIIDRTLLSPPTNLRGIAKTTSSITIAFDAPTDGIIYTYDISYSPVRVGSSVVTVDNTTYDIIGLESAVLYTILVNTRDANNNTSLQVSTTYSTLLPAPTNLIATGRTTTTIDISFNKPAGTMNSYTVSATYVSGASTLSITPQTFNDSPVSSVFQTYTITGLLSNTKYTANVYATKGSVNSSYSNDIVDYSTLIVQNASFSNYTAFSGTLASSATGISSLSIDNTGTRITVSSSNQGYFIYYTKSGSTWSARNNVLIGSTAAIITMAMTPDGNRGIASGYDNRCYYFTWTGTTYTALTRTLHTTTLGACKGIGITGDGNTIVYTDDSTKCIYFAKWNGTNYNAFTKTLDISRNTYYGLGISSDGSKIAYGQFPGNKVYVAYWNGTNYGVGTAITYLGTAFARHIKFSPGGNVIYMSMLSDASGSIQYSILNIDTYPTFKYIPTTSIPASFDAAGFYVDLSGVLYVYRTQSVNTSTPTYTPPAT